MTNEMKKIQIFDTTLRDGEQSPGASMGPEHKIIIARQLAKLGIDVIEPGFPISSPGEFAAVQQISRELQHVEIAGFARADERGYRCGCPGYAGCGAQTASPVYFLLGYPSGLPAEEIARKRS